MDAFKGTISNIIIEHLDEVEAFGLGEGGAGEPLASLPEILKPPVSAVATFSPDGKSVLVAGRGKGSSKGRKILAYSAVGTTGMSQQPLAEWEGHVGEVRGIGENGKASSISVREAIRTSRHI